VIPGFLNPFSHFRKAYWTIASSVIVLAMKWGILSVDRFTTPLIGILDAITFLLCMAAALLVISGQYGELPGDKLPDARYYVSILLLTIM